MWRRRRLRPCFRAFTSIPRAFPRAPVCARLRRRRIFAARGEVYNLPGGTAIPDAPEALAQEGEAEEYVFRNHARIIENEEATNAAFVAMEEAMCDMDSSSEERLTAVEEALCELDSAANGGGEN